MSARSKSWVSSFDLPPTLATSAAPSGRDFDRLVVGHLDDDLLEVGFEDLARQHALLEPALQLSGLAAGVQQALREGFREQAVLGRRDAEIDRLLISLGQEVDALHADLLRVELGIETGAQHGIAEAARIFVEQLLELLVAGIEGFDIGAHVLGEGAVGEHVLADLVGALADALVMAAHAGDAVGHRAVELTVVEHDLGRALVQAGARRGIQIIGLEAVRQAEDGLAAVMLEGISAVRTKRVHEQALLRPVALEVVRRPEIAGGDRVTLDQAIMLGHA